jgi:hypothetical protein
VAALEEVYCLRRVRIFGDDVRILRCYPGQWQVRCSLALATVRHAAHILSEQADWE